MNKYDNIKNGPNGIILVDWNFCLVNTDIKKTNIKASTEERVIIGNKLVQPSNVPKAERSLKSPAPKPSIFLNNLYAKLNIYKTINFTINFVKNEPIQSNKLVF